MSYQCEPGGGPRLWAELPFSGNLVRVWALRTIRGWAEPGGHSLVDIARREPDRSASGPVPPVSVSWSRPGVPQGVGYPRRAKACPVQFKDATGRSCVGSTEAPAAPGQCVDGHARNCYSDHPVGTASQRPSDCRRRLSSREICPEQSFGHPAPTPAVVVCARSLLENGRDESQKPVRAIHTYFCTFGLYVN